MSRSTFKQIGWTLAALLALVAAVLVIYALLPARWNSARDLGQLLRSLAAQPLGPLVACSAYALLASAFVPVTALIAATALVFDPLPAFVCALCGSLLSAALSHGAGQLASGPILRRIRGGQLATMRERLTRHAFSATVAARMLPLGNFATINLLAGALAVPFWPYMLGNLVGMLFGIAALTLLTGRIARIVRHPTAANVAIAAGVLVVALALGYALTRWLRRGEPGAIGERAQETR